MLKKALFCTALFSPAFAVAHPVSFKDGYGIMPGYTSERQELELNYTFDSSSAVAFNTINIDYRNDNILFLLPQFNHKFYRKNELGSQANLYGSLGIGSSEYRGDTGAAGMVGLQADYETRRIYTLFYAEHLEAEEAGLNRLRYRFGAAPYLANFNDLNTWFIAQVEYTPELNETWTITPMVRLFYQNCLIEIGVSVKGDPFFAGIFHF